jgi:hypothetical protein
MTVCIRPASIALLLAVACAPPPAHSHNTAGSVAGAGPPAEATLDASVRADLEKVRRATAAYRDIAAARADGFPSGTPRCLSHPTHGVMGYHYADARRMDGTLELERPEILLYARDSTGAEYLTGVEYIVPLAEWTRREPPRLLGQTFKRSEQLRIWYLHVWLWTTNPSGVFADYNPAVTC